MPPSNSASFFDRGSYEAGAFISDWMSLGFSTSPRYMNHLREFLEDEIDIAFGDARRRVTDTEGNEIVRGIVLAISEPCRIR